MPIFQMQMREKPWPAGAHAARPCPICGRKWFPWAGSYLPCHARCLFTESAEEAIFDCPDSARAIGENLGVSESLIRSTIVRVSKRRGAAKEQER